MVLGAGAMAAVSGGLRRQDWPPFRQLVGAALGGVLMGIGARLGFGCNIGAFLAGIASGSLHGWIWFVMAMAVLWPFSVSGLVMVRLTPKFIYLFLLLAGLGLATADHLTSRSMAGLGAPSDLGNVCAPCGAPCTE